MKAFDISTTIKAYERISKLVPYPLHLGITEAGTFHSGSIRSAIGIGSLLYSGIGDTLRVSLSDDPTKEVSTGIEILKSLGLSKSGAILVACPSCGRADVDIRTLANQLDDIIKDRKSNIKVAVMGCEVNGPGEAASTDIGITGGGKGNNMLYLSGIQTEKILTKEIISKVVNLVEKKVSEIRKTQ